MLLSFFSAGAIAFGLVLGAVVAAPDVDGGASFTRVSAEPGVFLLPSMSPPRWSWPGEPAPGVLPGALGVWALATAMPAIRAPAAAMVINFLMGISSVLVQRKGVLIFNRTTFASPVYNREHAGLFPPRTRLCVRPREILPYWAIREVFRFPKIFLADVRAPGRYVCVERQPLQGNIMAILVSRIDAAAAEFRVNAMRMRELVAELQQRRD